MTLRELAAQYRQSASMLYGRIKELRERLQKEDMCEMDKLRMRGRIIELQRMYHDDCVTAFYLEKYYDRGQKHGSQQI